MKKAVINYFSGTGNTAHAAQILAKELKILKFKTEIRQIKSNVKPTNEQFDFHLFLFPVYALSIPYMMQKYMQKLPLGNGAKAVVIANHGMLSLKGGLHTGYESQGPEKARRILKRKGYDVIITDKVGYPENITLVANPPSQKECNDIIKKADIRIKEISQKIARNKRSLIKYNVIDLTLGWLFGLIFVYFGKWQIGKFYIGNRKCNACSMCVKSCPASAIRLLNKKPRWNFKCEACLCCYNICPQNAIQVSIIRAVFFLALSVLLVPVIINYYAPIINLLLKYAPGILQIFPLFQTFWFALFLGTIIYLVLFVVIFFIFDKVFFVIELIPFFRRIIEWTYSKNIIRYLASGFKPF